MATVTQTKLLTAEEFMAADLGEGSFELVRGEIVEVPLAMPKHGVVCANVSGTLWVYGRKSGYGFALSNDSAVVTERDPDTVRGPDVCFYSHARLPRAEVAKGLPPVPPDLAVEVVSPGNRAGEISTKIAEYQAVGTLLVWVVYPKSRTVVIHRLDDEPPVVLREDAVIENLPELPGFRCPVSDFFV
jgi:Uma2 family endonuclease